MEDSHLIIAHRGYCSMFPENTLESFQAALYKCQLVEFDILLTKDHRVIVFHDRGLSRLTNIASLEKHQHKKRVADYDVSPGSPEEREDWWVIDFTLEELRQLTVRQPFSQRPQLSNLKFHIPTLEEAIQFVLEIKKNRLKDNICGFLAEVKGQWESKDAEQDKILVSKFVSILQKYDLDTEEKCKTRNFPFVFQAFNHTILETLSKTDLNLPIVHLFARENKIDKAFLVQKYVKNMRGIGITEEHATPQIQKLCKQMNLQMFYWTLRDDHLKDIPFGLKTYREVYLHLLKVGINGFITEFPEFCHQYICEYLKE